MKKVIEWHKKQTVRGMNALNISWYGVAWIAWAKGVALGLLIWLLVYLVHQL
jgi:hypothetical protein